MGGKAAWRRLVGALYIVWLWTLPWAWAQTEWVTVRHVIDGDTVILQNNERVRLLGVDAPEIPSRFRITSQHYGQEARDCLIRLLAGQRVRLEGDDAQPPKDRFGRRLAYLFLDDGTCINRELVKEGAARAIRFLPYRFRNEFLALEKKARSDKRGLWAEPAGQDSRLAPVPAS